MKYIIKPFSEIMVKSIPVRKKYLNHLQTNCSLALKKIDESLKVKAFWDKLEIIERISEDEFGRYQRISSDNVEEWSRKSQNENWKILEEDKREKIIKVLLRVPWIESILEVEEFDLEEINEFAYLSKSPSFNEKFPLILKNCLILYKKNLEWKSFVVRVKRSGIHNFKSLDLEKWLWWALLNEIPSSKVDLHFPNFTLNIEIKDKKVYLVKNKYFWIWGYPVGTQEKVLSLISWGFDSSVSSFSMMKRGCKVDYLFFNLGWVAHETWVKEIANHLWKNFSNWYKAKFITVPFEEIVSYLVQNINHRFRWIILKRLFLRVADILSSPEYYAIIKWDSLGQVSSQTLKNMFVIDKASETLVLRPLISFNKQEIIDLTKQIWTYEFACNIPEYCWVISDKPATGARLEQILEEEKNFPFELLEKAISNKKIEWIDDVLETEKIWNLEVEIVSIPWENEVVIDIREEPKELESPLILEWVEVLKIPFFDISYDFEKLDQNKTYLFYCDKWILSKNFALALREKGFKNIKIFRPILNDSLCKVGNKN